MGRIRNTNQHMPPESGVQKKKRAENTAIVVEWTFRSIMLKDENINNKSVSYRDLKFKTTSPSKINNKKIIS